MNRTNLNILVASIFVFLVISCKKSKFIEPDTHINNRYQPLINGSSYIWQVDSIYYNDFTQTKDTFRFYVKEFIESEIKDKDIGRVKRIERYYKFSDTSAWRLNRVFTAQNDDKFYLRTEENNPLLKLIYPLFSKLSWNLNLKNGLPPLSITCLNDKGTETILNKNYDTVATILHIADSSLISYKYKVEKYASSIGLIFKQEINITDNNPQLNPDLPIKMRANKGFNVIYSLKDYQK